jgi:hypothetical protein
MGVKQPRGFYQKEKEVSEKKLVGKYSFYQRKRFPAPDPAGDKQENTIAVQIEPGENGSDKDRKRNQEIKWIPKKNSGR